MNKVFTFELAAPPARVAEALCSEAFHLASERERGEVLSTTFEVTERTDERVAFEVQSTEYKRKKTGGIDRSATQRSVTRNRYDVRAGTISWEYEGVGAQWVRCTGVYRLLPAGDQRTRIEHEVTIKVSVPLIGERIARYIVGEFETAWRRFCALLPHHLP